MYFDRIKVLLNDKNITTELKKDSNNKITNKLNNLVKSWLDLGFIDDYTYKQSRCTNSNLPRYYGLPKVSQDGLPFTHYCFYIGQCFLQDLWISQTGVA